MRRRIALVVLAVHGLLLWLLLLAARHQPGREPEPPQFVSAWISATVPEPAASAPRALSPPIPPPHSAVKHQAGTPPPPPTAAITLPALPGVPQPPAPAAPSSSAVTAPVLGLPELATQAAKETADAAAAKRDTFSPPPKTVGSGCKPKDSSMEWRGEEDRRAGMAGILPYFRAGKRCVIVLFIPQCTLGDLPEANGHLLDDMKDADRPHSSVPDPNNCD